jgi:hypothetical protein
MSPTADWAARLHLQLADIFTHFCLRKWMVRSAPCPAPSADYERRGEVPHGATSPRSSPPRGDSRRHRQEIHLGLEPSRIVIRNTNEMIAFIKMRSDGCGR